MEKLINQNDLTGYKRNGRIIYFIGVGQKKGVFGYGYDSSFILKLVNPKRGFCPSGKTKVIFRIQSTGWVREVVSRLGKSNNSDTATRLAEIIVLQQLDKVLI